jgi:lipopolysaccharide export system protein LptA
MKRSQAARYARASAAVAALLAIVTSGVYLEHKWKARMAKAHAPPPAPHGVERQSSGISFSKVDGNRTIFTVDASKSTDFKDKYNGASLLEDVRITIFGQKGDRHDTIHTQSCRQYGNENGNIVCSGDVQIDMQSAGDAERVAKKLGDAVPQIVHVETHGVTFDRTSGLAQTGQPVKFVFPSGTGNAVGVEYKSEAGMIKLLHDVHLTLQPQASAAPRKPGKPELAQEVQVSGANLEFARDTRIMHLAGPAQADTKSARLMAGDITLLLNSGFRPEKLLATAGTTGKQPELKSLAGRAEMNMSGDSLTAGFAPEGWVTKVDATGNVHGTRKGAQENDEFSAASGTLDLWPRVSQPKELNLNGSVSLKTKAVTTGDARALQTNALRMNFTGGKEGEPNKPKRAETLSAGKMEWTDSAAVGGAAVRTKLQADKLAMDFGPLGKAKQLQAVGNVQTERAVEGKPVQTATANNGVAQLLATGGWSQMDLQGDVKLKEADHTGQAEHAVFLRAAQTATLTGQAVARDTTTETHAPRITFAQATGDIRAEGGVRSTDFSAKASGVQLAPVPANISSDTMQANSKTGRALYTGHARLWQGDSVLEAESIELLREARVLNANGNVRAVFPEVAQTSARPAGQAPAAVMVSQPAVKKTTLWHVSSGTLNYRDAESRALLEKNVVVKSTEQTMRGPALELYFTRGTQAGANGTNGSNSATGQGTAQQISRAVGTGGVVVEQAQRKATAERGEYTAADGKFVMSGGTPTLSDAAEGTTTGRQLTFFLADDTIIVDSENGSRTLTKHRVEK